MAKPGHSCPELVFLRQAREQKIGLFGGSFNPLHDGHWQCAEGLRKAKQLDQVWWLPTPFNPLKKNHSSDNFQDRIQAIEQRIAGHPKHCLSLLMAEGCFNYTIDFLKFLNNFRNNNTLFWLAGSDILAELHHWRDWRKLPQYCEMLFYSRPSHELRRSPQCARTFSVVMGKRLRLSSRQIRAIEDTQK